MNTKAKPRKVYKYKAFDVFTLRLLTTREIYYANPTKFNDPLDCRPTISIDVDRASIEHLFYAFLPIEEAKAAIGECHYMATQYDDYVESENGNKYIVRLLADDIKRLLDKEMGGKGVLSFGEKWDCPLMWSHYADEHRGICIEFDTTRAIHTKLEAISYRSPRNVKISDIIAWKSRKSSEAERLIYNTYFYAKASQWRYEKEWRDIRERSDEFPTEFPVTAIYLGMRCDPAVTTCIVKLLSGKQSVVIYEVYPQDDSFRLRRRRADRDEIEACGVRTSPIFFFENVS